MAKKKQNIQLEGLADLDFNKEPDIAAAQSVIRPEQPVEEPAPKIKKVTKPKPKTEKAPADNRRSPAAPRTTRSTFPPVMKKRATFNVDEDLHRALKDYSYFEEVDMVEYIFEQLVKPDLVAKGYYPPKRKKR